MDEEEGVDAPPIDRPPIVFERAVPDWAARSPIPVKAASSDGIKH